VIVTIPGPLKIDGIEFDNVTYDREVDVLYLWAGAPRRAAFDDASSEGHYLQFGEDGVPVAITIVNARWLLERDGKIVITLPGRRIEAHGLGPVLAAA
jgi:hypothetical protein